MQKSELYLLSFTMPQKTFTHLCEKVNLSLYDDTLTIYLKDEHINNQDDMIDFDAKIRKLGASRHVNKYNPAHNLYHQDNFNKKAIHSHVQFQKSIDEEKLKEILSILVKECLITSEEQQSFMKAYKEANPLPYDFSNFKGRTRVKNSFFYPIETSIRKKGIDENTIQYPTCTYEMLW